MWSKIPLQQLHFELFFSPVNFRYWLWIEHYRLWTTNDIRAWTAQLARVLSLDKAAAICEQRLGTGSHSRCHYTTQRTSWGAIIPHSVPVEVPHKPRWRCHLLIAHTHPQSRWLVELMVEPKKVHYGTKVKISKGRHQWKKNVFFRTLPESPKPPSPDPNSGNLVLFFGGQNSRFKSKFRTNYTIYTI